MSTVSSLGILPNYSRTARLIPNRQTLGAQSDDPNKPVWTKQGQICIKGLSCLIVLVSLLIQCKVTGVALSTPPDYYRLGWSPAPESYGEIAAIKGGGPLAR